MKIFFFLLGGGLLLWLIMRSQKTPALNVGPNPVLKTSQDVRPQGLVGPAILALAPKVTSWFSQPTNRVSDGPPTDFNYDDVVNSYYAPGTYGSDEENPD